VTGKDVSIIKGATGPSVPHTARRCLPQFCGFGRRHQWELRIPVKLERWPRALSRDGAQEGALAQRGFQYKLSFNPPCAGNPTGLSKVAGTRGSAEQQLRDNCPEVFIAP